MLRKKIVYFQKNLQLCCSLLFHSSYNFSLIHQKRFYENKKFHFPVKIRYGKNVKKQNCLFQKDLQL